MFSNKKKLFQTTFNPSYNSAIPWQRPWVQEDLHSALGVNIHTRIMRFLPFVTTVNFLLVCKIPFYLIDPLTIINIFVFTGGNFVRKKKAVDPKYITENIVSVRLNKQVR